MGTLIATAAVVILGIITAAVAVPVLWLSFRRRRFSSGAGSFDCAYFQPGDAAGEGRWRPGIARFADADLAWYPLFGVRLTPGVVVPRLDTTVARREPLEPDDTGTHLARRGALDIELAQADGARVRLGMSPAAYAGLSSWLEALPPGHNSRIGNFT